MREFLNHIAMVAGKVREAKDPERYLNSIVTPKLRPYVEQFLKVVPPPPQPRQNAGQVQDPDEQHRQVLIQQSIHGAPHIRRLAAVQLQVLNERPPEAAPEPLQERSVPEAATPPVTTKVSVAPVQGRPKPQSRFLFPQQVWKEVPIDKRDMSDLRAAVGLHERVIAYDLRTANRVESPPNHAGKKIRRVLKDSDVRGVGIV